MMSRAFAASLLLLSEASACAAPKYRYAPVMLTNAELEGRPAVEAMVPAAEPRARAPVVAIEPRQTHRVDLVYELPPGATKAEHVEAFDVLWTLRAGPEVSSGKAAFQRLSAGPPGLPVSDDTNPPPQRGPGRYAPRP